MSEYSIGVDLGGTNLRAAAVSREGKILNKVSGATPAGSGREALMADIVRSIETIQGSLASQSDGHVLRGIGVGIPGIILMEKGMLVGAPNLPELVNYPVRDEIEKRLGMPVTLENDANAAALGEKWMGAGRDVDDLILLTLGTGVGGGIVLGGRVHHGYLGMAAELGHLTVVPNGNPCGCGSLGCLEQYASASAVAGMARMLSLGRDLSAEDVFELAQGGNPRARQIFETVGTSLGIAIGNLINVFNAPLYLVGGGVAAAWEQFAPALMAEVSRRSYIYRAQPPRIERAALGSDAGLYGAASVGFGGAR